jgi:ElaB/YqjD/DUF883 family membrane-anchored ribosome-binding protein
MTPDGDRERAAEEAAAVSGDHEQARAPDQPRADDPEEIREGIEQTREELGDTVEALAHKADVKAQVQDRVEERKQALQAKGVELKERVSGARDKVSGATPDDVRQGASHATTQLAETTRSRPVPMVLGAFAAGLALGLLIARR